MSGIYVHGMEMPKDGFITITVTFDGRVVGNSKKESGKFEYLDNEYIASAIFVPDHGPLSDVRLLAKELYNRFEDAPWVRSTALDSVLRFIRKFPTVIPADKE